MALLPSSSPGSWRLLVLNSDRLLAGYLALGAAEVLPGSQVRTATSLHEARSLLHDAPVDLLVGGLALPDGCLLDYLTAQRGSMRPYDRALAIEAELKPSVLRHLRALAVAGVIDPDADDVAVYGEALRGLVAGHSYWSASVERRMESETSASGSLLRCLTPKEELIFAAIGDGSDDLTASRWLGMSPATVQTVRRELHFKTGAHCRSELILAAVRYGVVLFKSWGVMRPGFSLLLEAYQKRGSRASWEVRSA